MLWRLTIFEKRRMRSIALDHPYFDGRKPLLSKAETEKILARSREKTGQQVVEEAMAQLGLTYTPSAGRKRSPREGLGDVFCVPGFRRTAILAALILLLVLLMTLTPAGRAMAQSVYTIFVYYKDGREQYVPSTCTDGVIIERNVEIGVGTEILPNTILKRNTSIGKNCVIGPNTRVENCKIGDDVSLNTVQAYDSVIESGVNIGPYVHIRPDSLIRSDAKIGDFVEIKNSTIGEKTAIAHLAYVGDSDIGKRVNIGCGTVTVNYDGIAKSRCIIGDNCFIGCNTNLIAPVKLGKAVYTAAGTTVTRDVPDYALAIDRGVMKINEGYTLRKLKTKLGK